jgi:hypothetical protein
MLNSLRCPSPSVRIERENIIVLRRVISKANISCGAGGRRWSIITGPPRLDDGIDIYLTFGYRKGHVILAGFVTLHRLLRSVVLVLCPFAIVVSGILKS